LLVASLLVVFYPVPGDVLDVLLAGNIAVSVLLLLSAMYASSPLELTTFPTLLLLTTVGRVVLNFASTRLILTNAAEKGTEAAGGVIQSFGDFVSAGDPAVGFILFLILIVIQFVVVTKGTTRISEVAARFALDGMPGRQMAIDGDLTHGIITAEQATLRRERVTREADFYGAMDGAGKFVRGDAVAGLIITAVNILGGLLIGVVRHGMSVAEAGRVFSVLTIGDGLACQVPAFLVSIAAGLIMTRTSEDSNLPSETVSQLVRRREVFIVAAVFLGALAMLGLPTLPLAGLSGLCIVAACLLPSENKRLSHAAANRFQAVPAAEAPSLAAKPSEGSPQESANALQIEPLELELGVGLVRLADRRQNGDLLDRVVQLRNRIAQELGFILPKVRIHDNLRLDPRQYQILMRGVPLAIGEAYADGVWAVDDGAATGQLTGIEGLDPVTQRKGWWIELSRRDEARSLGFRVEDASSRIIRHLGQVVRNHADELLTRQHVHELLSRLKEQAPRLIEDVVPQGLKAATIHRMLCGLLRERVPIRDLETIVESLGDAESQRSGDLIEQARLALRRTICQQYRDENHRLDAVALDDEAEASLLDELDSSADKPRDRRSRSSDTMPQLAEALSRLIHAGRPPVVVCSPELRQPLRTAVAAGLPQAAVLSFREITPDTELRIVATVSPSRRAQALV
jgi:flagellar biosynthesis protein FlhA